jgi:hypothetical protein
MAQGTTRSGVCAYGMALQRGLSEVANLRVMPGRPHSRAAQQAGPAHEGEGRKMSMHADEEADEVVVPVKRSNKGL